MKALFLSFWKDVNDFALVVAMIGILLILFTPIPAEVLDFLLLLNFSAALMILMVTFYTDKPLEFSTFPSLLLMTTLFRLALNISSTRLILDDAHAGKFIGAVGDYVVGGNYVIGLVVFLILIIVQYVVVTNGAQRVAEVAARFTLDSLPGKQMSVDADLNMGIINHDEAKVRRGQLERESNFYGAMDGASKFVKGDAIAGILIIFINIIGGLSIGMAQKGMGWTEALHQYTLLTVGDGIVTQVPSLVIAVATGIIITRAATDARLGEEILRQFSMNPKTIVIVAVAMLMFAMLPGMPVVPVLIIAVGLALISWLAFRKWKVVEDDTSDGDQGLEAGQDNLEKIYADMVCLPLELKAGAEIREFLQKESVGLEKRLTLMRKNIAKELGFVLPVLSLRKDSGLKAQQYHLFINGERLASGEIHADKLLGIKRTEDTPEIDGIATKEPTYGMPATWLEPESRERAMAAGYTIVEPELVLLTHLQEVVRRNAHRFVTRQYVEELMESRKSELGSMVEELVPAQMTYSDIQRVLQLLLQEQVPIRNLPQLFEVLVDVSRERKDPELLAESCRQVLKGAICEKLSDADGNLSVISLGNDLEQKLLAGFSRAEGGGVPIGPKELETLMSGVVKHSESLMKKGRIPVLLCPGEIRRQLKKLLTRVVPQLSVLSLNEVDERFNVSSAGVISTQR